MKKSYKTDPRPNLVDIHKVEYSTQRIDPHDSGEFDYDVRALRDNHRQQVSAVDSDSQASEMFWAESGVSGKSMLGDILWA